MADDDSSVNANVQDNLGNPDSNLPGRRLNNPLGYMASYTYKWTLYIVTPDTYSAWSAAGARDIPNIGGGAYAVFSSGGINSDVYTRPESIPFDYYIDSVSLTTLTAPNNNQGGPAAYEFKMSVVEPIGFSLITNLKKLALEVAPQTSFVKQFFLLEVQFYGWDMEGNLVKGSDTFDGRPIDPNASGNSLFKRVFDVKFQGVTFSLGTPKGTVYNMKFVPCGNDVQGPKLGWLYKEFTLDGETVDACLQKLADDLNAQQLECVKMGTRQYPNIYKFTYADPESAAIGAAAIVNQEELEKTRYPMPPITNTTTSTEAASAQSAPTDTKKPTNKNNQSIIQTIDDIIKSSAYTRAALTAVQKGTTGAPPRAGPDPESGEFPVSVNDTPRRLAWYTVAIDLTSVPPKPDLITKGWAYTINYQITKYYTPVINAAYIGDNYSYFGPHKRYEYLFTGQNKEILSYTQNFNNNFYLVVFANPDGTISPVAPKDATLETSPCGTQGDPSGAQGTGMQSQNAMINSLYDPSAYAKATIKIMGDPDYLCSLPPPGNGVGLADTESGIYNHFYQDVKGGDKFCINPVGSQVFIEVDFKEGVDYNENTGLLDVNRSILFWEYPPALASIIKGVAYQVFKVDHSFSQGKFEQTLHLVPTIFPDGDIKSAEDLQNVANQTEGVEEEKPAEGETTTPATGTVATGANDDQGTG